MASRDDAAGRPRPQHKTTCRALGLYVPLKLQCFRTKLDAGCAGRTHGLEERFDGFNTALQWNQHSTYVQLTHCQRLLQDESANCVARHRKHL